MMLEKISLDNSSFRKILNLVLLLLILGAVLTTLYMNYVGRSLWLDEAMLAYSFSQRDLLELTDSKFECMQSAPVLYLYIVKIITLIFGNTEHTLRLWSFITYVLLVISCFYILKKILVVKLPLLGTALIANLPLLMYYSSEFKPYMSDCFSIFLLIIVYYWYSNNKINTYIFALILALLVWNSNPVCFFIGGVLIYDFFNSLLQKDYKKLVVTICIGLVVLGSFVAYYFYWLKPVIDAGDMDEYWKETRFIWIPTSLSELDLQLYLIKDMIRWVGRTIGLILFIALPIGLVITVKERNKYLIIIYLSVFITLIASSLGMYPFSSRLFLFIYPLAAIILFYSLNRLFTKNAKWNLLILAVSLFIIVLPIPNGVFVYSKKENNYRYDEETNFITDYVIANIKEGDNLYVYRFSVPGFLYRIKYDNTHFLLKERKVKFGNNDFLDLQNNPEDINYILSNGPTYLIVSHFSYPESLKDSFESFKDKGKLEIVYEIYGTKVYYYTPNEQGDY